MGIQGLTTCMERYFSGEWREIQLEGHLVIDGYSLCHSLYSEFHIDWIHGGQYWSFRRHLKEFFNSLKRNSIQPLVVFDGIDFKREKEKTLWKRKVDRIKEIRDSLLSGKCVHHISAQMSIDVFRETLEELRIPLYVVDGEADWDTVAMANYYKCPVVANDSDYYMYNIEAGYIPIYKLYWKNEPVTANIYTIQGFAQSVGFCTSEICLVIPAVVGNDLITTRHIPQALLADIEQQNNTGTIGSSKQDQIHQFILYLARFQSIDDFFVHLSSLWPGNERFDHSIKENFEKCKEMYVVKEPLSEEKLMSSTELKTSNGNPLPEWILNQYRSGYFVGRLMESLVVGQYFLHTVIDNPHHESAQLCSRGIRQCVYGILAPYMKELSISEVIRFDASLRREDVPIRQDIPNLPTVDKVHELSQLDRLHALCTVMECDPVMLEGFDDKWKLPLLATCYWVRHAHPSPHVIETLVLCFVLCSRDRDPSSFLPRRRPREDYSSHYWLDYLHCFTKWQCVYFDAMTLNNILFNPLRFITPALLFDGRLVMYYACKRDLSAVIAREMSGSSLYSKIVDTAISFLPHSKKKPSKPTTPATKHPKAEGTSVSSKMAATGGLSTTVTGGLSRFAMLTIEDDDDDDVDQSEDD